MTAHKCNPIEAAAAHCNPDASEGFVDEYVSRMAMCMSKPPKNGSRHPVFNYEP
jgi:hypothetical protein